MRITGHFVYISLLVITALSTYYIASPKSEVVTLLNGVHDKTSDNMGGTHSAAQWQPTPLPNHVTHHISTDSKSDTGSPSSDTPNSDDWMRSRIEALEAEVLEYQDTMAQLSYLTQRLDNDRIEKQRAKGRDIEWATEVELDIETLFIRDERLRNISIEEMQCFSEHCEVTLTHMDLTDGFPTSYFMQLINQEERLKAQNFGVMSVGGSEHTQLTLSKIEPKQP